MILLIDNYDSFSYNLYQLIGEINSNIKVIRNNEMTLKEVKMLHADYIVISPGPGRPKDAGICEDVIKHFTSKVPILGICLGHQAICEAFGAKITYAKEIMHGKTSDVIIDTHCPIFLGLENQIKVARYHSLVADQNSIPECLLVTAKTLDGEIMAVKHKKYNTFGLQFHPESILSQNGKNMIKNFLMSGNN